MHLMEMIMKGDSSSGVDGTKCAAFNITQLVYFNFLRHRRSNYLLNIWHLQKKRVFTSNYNRFSNALEDKKWIFCAGKF